jgi:small GTP-binding protein
MNAAPSFRVVLVGDSEAGKTSIIQSYVRGEFSPNQKNTIAAVFHTIAREIGGQRVQLQIWDTAGQEKYRSIGPIYYREACAAIAVFDATVDDFEDGLDAWIDSVKRSAVDPRIFVVGNKADLLADEEGVAARIRTFAESRNAEWLLTSAKDGTNIRLLFERVIAAVASGIGETMDVIPTEPAPPPAERACC